MNRRGIIKIGGGTVVAGLGGIRLLSPRVDQLHRLRPTTPFPLVVHNIREDPTTSDIAVERDGNRLVTETLVLDSNESAQVIEIDRAGTYDVRIESEGMSEEKRVRVKWAYLADCNTNRFRAEISDDGIDIRLVRTDLRCGIL